MISAEKALISPSNQMMREHQKIFLHISTWVDQNSDIKQLGESQMSQWKL